MLKSTVEEMNQIFDIIESYDSIVIFGHMNPDGDCVGSVMGLRAQLRQLFPNKKIYGVGTHPKYLPSYLEESDDVSDEIIKNSLAIMVDLSDLERVEDQRIHTAKEIVCFDHHIASKGKDYGFPVYRDTLAPSATYVLTKCLLERYHVINDEAAMYFYLGLVTDTGRFQFDSQPETMEVAALLLSHHVDYKRMYRELYKQTSRDLKYRAFIYNNYAFNGKVTYCVVRKEDYQKLGLTSNEASGKVNLLSMLDNHPMWVTFTQQEDDVIRVEFRSDGTYNVQIVAKQFGGGGHLAASGAKLTTFDDVDKVLEAMNKLEVLD